MSAQLTSIKGGLKARKTQTEGSILLDVRGAGQDELGNPIPIIREYVNDNGEVSYSSPYYILVFEDGTQFTLTEGAANYLLAEDFRGVPNEDYLPCGFVPGVKLSAMREPETGRPIIKMLD